VADKMSKKELKSPDTFQKVGGEARDWMASRQKLIATAVAAVLGIGLLVALVSYFSRRSDEQTQAGLGDALRPLTEPVAGKAQAQPGQKPFGSEREQTEAARTKLAEYQKAHGEGAAGLTALLGLAHAEMHLGNNEVALPLFEDYSKKAAKEDPLVATALEAKGYLLEAKGDLAGAMAAFEDLAARNTGEFMKGLGQYHRGRLLMVQDKKQEAATVFQETQTQFPNTQAATWSGERLSALAGMGVVPQPAAAPAPAAPAAAADGG
jgi:tetratricopeptide (TPR) repeat protein